MAVPTVARDSALVGRVLDSPPITALIAELDAARWTGRPGNPTRSLVGAALVKAIYALPTWSRTAALIADHPGLQAALGASPSVYACYRFQAKLHRHHDLLARCIDRTVQAVAVRNPDYGIDIAVDASDLPAWANGQRYISKGGPKRERYSDPDASWGHRSAVSTRKGGGFYGYKVHAAVCARTDLPVAWRVETARSNESQFAASLVEQARARGLSALTCALDKGYDIGPVYDALEALRCKPVIPLRNTTAVARGDHLLAWDGPPTRLHPRLDRASKTWKALYRGRAAVEREFGRLKHEWGLLPLRHRGLRRVELHADLTVLAKLSAALANQQEVPRVPRFQSCP